MNVFKKSLFSILHNCVDIFFRFRKPLIDLPWQLKIPDDTILVEPSKREKIPIQGCVKLFLRSRFSQSLLGASPFLTAFFDGKKHFFIFPRHEFWELAELFPYKARMDNWRTQRGKKNDPHMCEYQHSQTHDDPPDKPVVKPKVSFEVTPPKSESSSLKDNH